MESTTKLGAAYQGDSTCAFLVWAPKAERVDLHLFGPVDRLEPLAPLGAGYFGGKIDRLDPGARYKYRLNGLQEFPDPASRYQPEGVHGPSQVVPIEFPWTDQDWRGLPLENYIIYELHIGTFTPAGTFEAAAEQLDYLKDLGVTAIEIMPVAQFPGDRNWGYDGVYSFAVQASYGGPLGLKHFVNAAHGKGLAVVLDVVYNHFGPEGNYFDQYGHYFTGRYHTPWGRALNFDDENNAGVRRFVLENVLQWIVEFHIDALRLDAIHSMFDSSGRHILSEIAATVHRNGGDRRLYLIAESNLNDVRIVRSQEEGGFGLDAQWNDDFHHALHALLTNEREGYYCDYGDLHHLAKAFAEGFIYSGQFSRYRNKLYGASSRDIPAHRFVVFSQNHDQTGNRMLGDRLSHLLAIEELKLAAGAVILSPFVPMIFMGQEYAESAPFLYFVHHSDSDLIEAVRQGRRAEFAAFAWQGDAPDPQSEETFLRSKLHHELKNERAHQALLEFYRELLRLRKSHAALRNLSKANCNVVCLKDTNVIAMRRWHADHEILVVLHFGEDKTRVELQLPAGVWQTQLDSSDSRWLGPGGSDAVQTISNGSVSLQVGGKSVCVLTRMPSYGEGNNSGKLR
jgi:maltooligosyltrehalose trehalohydrolase